MRVYLDDEFREFEFYGIESGTTIFIDDVFLFLFLFFFFFQVSFYFLLIFKKFLGGKGKKDEFFYCNVNKQYLYKLYTFSIF